MCFDWEFYTAKLVGGKQNIQYREIDISLVLRMRNKASRKPEFSVFGSCCVVGMLFSLLPSVVWCSTWVMYFSQCSKAHFLPLTAGKGKLRFLEDKDKLRIF